jgi:hypothetical protein
VGPITARERHIAMCDLFAPWAARETSTDWAGDLHDGDDFWIKTRPVPETSKTSGHVVGRARPGGELATNLWSAWAPTSRARQRAGTPAASPV